MIFTYLIINLTSTILQLSYYFNDMDENIVILYEKKLIFFKTFMEIFDNKISFYPIKGEDLLIHHLMMFIYLEIINYYSQWTFMLIRMQIVHIPLLFYYLFKFTKNIQQLTKLFEIINLCLWPPSIIFRNLSLGYYLIHSNLIEEKITFLILLPLFVYLDYIWTPIKKYKKLFHNLTNIIYY